MDQQLFRIFIPNAQGCFWVRLRKVEFANIKLRQSLGLLNAKLKKLLNKFSQLFSCWLL
jgi:hypothetical protein